MSLSKDRGLNKKQVQNVLQVCKPACSKLNIYLIKPEYQSGKSRVSVQYIYTGRNDTIICTLLDF